VNPALRSALDAADRGWQVFPCHGIDRRLRCACGRADCGSPGKHPLLKHGLTEATTDTHVLASWWRRWPQANLAVRTGVESGLVVVDVDPPIGFASLTSLEQTNASLDRTCIVRTGSGGAHYYFAHPGGGARIANRASSVLGQGIDIRGDGGYVIAPPSLHASGNSYVREAHGEPPPMPTWLVELLTIERRHEPVDPRQIRGDRGVSAWAATALAGEIERVQTAAEGTRNQTLNRSAFVLGQIVGGGHLEHDDVADLLGQAGLAAGLGEREVRMTVSSGLRSGAHRPRHPPDRARADPIDLRAVDLDLPRPAARTRTIEREL
jgi:hypothetical protein